MKYGFTIAHRPRGMETYAAWTYRDEGEYGSEATARIAGYAAARLTYRLQRDRLFNPTLDLELTVEERG